MALSAAVLKVCFDSSIAVLISRGLGLGTSALVNEAAELAKREVILVSPDLYHHVQLLEGSVQLLEDIATSPAMKKAFSATEPSVLFIDGLDRIDPKLQMQFVELVRHRRLGEEQLPANVTIVVTAENESVYGTLRAISPFVYQYSMS